MWNSILGLVAVLALLPAIGLSAVLLAQRDSGEPEGNSSRGPDPAEHSIGDVGSPVPGPRPTARHTAPPMV